MKRTTIIGIIAVVIILIAAVAIAGGESNPDKDKVQYDYEVEISNSFPSTVGGSETAPAGSTFAIVHIYVKNIGFDEGMSLNDFVWQWKAHVNGMTYSPTVSTYLHPEYKGLSEVEVGGETTTVQVFAVPAGTTVDMVTMTMDYFDFGPTPAFERVDHF